MMTLRELRADLKAKRKRLQKYVRAIRPNLTPDEVKAAAELVVGSIYRPEGERWFRTELRKLGALDLDKCLTVYCLGEGR